MEYKPVQVLTFRDTASLFKVDKDHLLANKLDFVNSSGLLHNLVTVLGCKLVSVQYPTALYNWWAVKDVFNISKVTSCGAKILLIV